MMPNINVFPVSTFQSVLDWFITAMQWIRTPVVLGKILPFLVVVWVVGVIVFGFLALPFRVFAEISERTFHNWADTVEDFLMKNKWELSRRDYQKMIKNGTLKYTNEPARKKDIGKVVDSM